MTPRPPSEPAGRVCPKRCACPVLCPEGADRTGTGAQRSGKRNTHPGAWKTGDPTSFFLPGREDDGRAAHRTASLQVFTQELAQVGETRPVGTGSKGPVPLRPRPHRGTALSFPTVHPPSNLPGLRGRRGRTAQKPDAASPRGHRTRPHSGSRRLGAQLTHRGIRRPRVPTPIGTRCAPGQGPGDKVFQGMRSCLLADREPACSSDLEISGVFKEHNSIRPG